MKRYYKAYDDRYRQVHSLGLQWSSSEPTPIVSEIIKEFKIPKSAKTLEIGCGEGRDAIGLLKEGYNISAADVSEEAVEYCRKICPEFREHFFAADCVAGEPEGEFDFIYAVAVLHMLVDDGDRRAFYRYIWEHLSNGGVALVCTMGDGKSEFSTDPDKAFEISARTHEETGMSVETAQTTCRMIGFETFRREISEAGLKIIKEGLTSSPPDFSSLLYAVVGAE